MPDKADLAIDQGDDYGLIVTVNNADGTPADLTGHTAQAQIRRAVADQDPVIVVEMTAVVLAPNFVNVSIPHTATEELTGKYVWDLQLISPEGAITTILMGKATVTLEVTREAASARTATV